MSGRVPYGKPRDFSPASMAGGVASEGEIVFGAYEQMRLVDNTNAAGAALEDAYETLRRDIKASTGLEPPGNPLIPDLNGFDPARQSAMMRGELSVELDWQAETVDRQRREFRQWMNDTAAKYPAEAVASWASRDPDQDARELARGADENLARLMDSNPGWSKYAAAFVGGAGGSLRDPLTVGSLALGGGPGAARTIAGRILTVAFKEALLNGGTELAAQPMVQDWRQRAGLPHGFDQAAANTLFAAGLGGVFGLGGRGLYEGVMFSRQRTAAREATAELARGQVAEVSRLAIEGDHRAAAKLLSEIRDELPAEVRGALDAAELDEAIEAARLRELDHLSQQRHDLLLSRAENTARSRELPASLDFDEARVARLVESLAPKPESITDRTGFLAERGDYDRLIADMRAGPAEIELRRRPVAGFLQRLGGIDPASSLAAELRARGIDGRNFPGLFSREGQRIATAAGVVVKPPRQALDNIPHGELPEALRLHMQPGEDGYVRQQDFVDGLEAELKGKPLRTPEDEAAAARVGDFEEHRAYLERNGVDFERMTDAQIKERLAAIDDAERRFMAAGDNEAGISTSETAFLPPGIARRAYTDQVVRDVLRLAGEGVPDDVVRMAVDTHLFAGETLEDAVDFALSTRAGVSKETPPSQFEAIGRDPPEPSGLDDPGKLLDDEDDFNQVLAELDDDFEIPFGDEILSAATMKQRIAETRFLESVVTACKT